MPPPTLNSEEPVNAHCRRFACERRTRWRRCVQVAEHLAHDAPLSAFVVEVVCTVGATLPRSVTLPSRTVTSPPSNGWSCATRGPVRDVPAGGIAIKWGELHH